MNGQAPIGLDVDGFFARTLELQTVYFEDVMKAVAQRPQLEARKFMAQRMRQLLVDQEAAAQKFLGIAPP